MGDTINSLGQIWDANLRNTVSQYEQQGVDNRYKQAIIDSYYAKIAAEKERQRQEQNYVNYLRNNPVTYDFPTSDMGPPVAGAPARTMFDTQDIARELLKRHLAGQAQSGYIADPNADNITKSLSELIPKAQGPDEYAVADGRMYNKTRGQWLDAQKPADQKTLNDADFQRAIAGITGPSAMGTQYPVGNTNIMTGYAPFPETEKDIRMAGADYTASDAAIKAAIDDARGFYDKQKIQGQPISVGRSKMTPEYNLFGDRKDEGKALTVSVNGGRSSGSGDATDALVAREAVKELPKLRREAQTAVSQKNRIDTMLPLVENGSAGGLQGNALAKVAGVFDVPATSEAELFKKLAAAGAGALRTQVVGPGPVSNYENQLLQAISGGGNGARSATIQLLKFYSKEADNIINNYNDAVDSATEVAPKAPMAFKKIGITPTVGPTQPATRTKGKKPAKDPLGIL